jgi:pectinesterase
MMRFIVAVSSLVSTVLAAGRTSPPSGSLTVGSGGTYSTVGIERYLVPIHLSKI